MLERNAVDTYLARIKDLKKDCPFFDMHVHPFAVMGQGLFYARNPRHDGIFSASSSSRYAPPAISPIKTAPDGPAGQRQDPELQARMATLAARFLYAHTGAGLFADHMRLSGINQVLLLPVLGPGEPEEPQMDMLQSMFGGDDRFALGYCVPTTTANHRIREAVQAAVRKYGIRAIKIHPNINGLDLGSAGGRERLEHILAAAGKAGLPVVVHGGRSTGLRESAAASAATLRNLQHIDWSLSGRAVVIAHAGTYGYDLCQAREEVLPLMNRLLARHDNLFVDVSGLEIDRIGAILRTVDVERIFFGSDALYSAQWSALVKLLHALIGIGHAPEERFVKIASLNPARHLFADGREIDQLTERAGPAVVFPDAGQPDNVDANRGQGAKDQERGVANALTSAIHGPVPLCRPEALPASDRLE